MRYCRKLLQGLAALLLLGAALSSASAQEQVRIGIGFGLAFLPLYVCEESKLIEKQGRLAHLDVKASFPRFMGAEPVQDAIAADAIDMAPFGSAPLLAAWQKAKDTPLQVFAVSGITTLPLVLLSNASDEHSIADLKPADHIGMPTLSSPQMYVLELQSEKVFGQFDRLSSQVVALSHADAMAAMVEGAGRVTAYFASPPFTELALRDAGIHPILNSEDVMNGKSSFLVMGATKKYIDAHPQMPGVIDKAMDEAARIIHDDPRRAAQIYLSYEPSQTINVAAMEEVIRGIKDEFGSAIYGMQTMADFMSRHGGLKVPPASWKDIVAPALLSSQSS
jgi:NitT/TauT family transport system substrate-binding protein